MLNTEKYTFTFLIDIIIFVFFEETVLHNEDVYAQPSGTCTFCNHVPFLENKNNEFSLETIEH